MSDFKFKIGDVVQHKGGEMVGVVVARTTEENSAGTCLTYWVTWFDRHGEDHQQCFGGCELEIAPPKTLADALTWVKEVAVSEQQFEVAADARDLAEWLRRAKASR